MPQSLTELANHYGTDKGTVGPTADWGGHNYTDVYEAYLARRRWDDIRLLEIGLGVRGIRGNASIVRGRNTGGASLKMWHDYFPHAGIYGIDVNACSELDNDRVTTFVADQGRIDDLERFTRATGAVEFDVIVDDGSHKPHHQQISFSYFFRWLKPGGLYFIEDLLPNGLGDASGSRTATVRNTRSVLKHYLRHGDFPEPNALIDPADLKDHIGSIAFHVPRLESRRIWAFNPRRPFRRILSYAPESESLCVIEKK